MRASCPTWLEVNIKAPGFDYTAKQQGNQIIKCSPNVPPSQTSQQWSGYREGGILVDWTARSLLEWVTFPRGTPGDYGAVTSFSWWLGIFCLCPFLKSQSWAVSLRSRRREAFHYRPLSLRTPVSECAQAAADWVITIPEISGSVQRASREELTFHLQW